MTKYKATGTLHCIGTTRELGSGKRLREFVLRWPGGSGWSMAKFVLKGDNVITLDGYQGGESVEAEFWLDGREWVNPKTGDTKVYTDLVCCGLKRKALL